MARADVRNGSERWTLTTPHLPTAGNVDHSPFDLPSEQAFGFAGIPGEKAGPASNPPSKKKIERRATFLLLTYLM